MLAENNQDKSTLTAALALLLCALLISPVALAQEDNSEADPADPSIETDISEDNYRRYMELKDPRLERPAFPTTVFKPPSSLEKMAQLPESSQKHLRNELRGIILQSGPWTPEELEREYRFTPSAEAQRDGQLLRAEAEAWAELVGEYHEREAASLANNPAGGAPATAQNPAANSESDGGMASNESTGSPGQDQQSGGGQQGQGGEDGKGETRNANNSSNSGSRPTRPEETWQDPAEGPGAGMSTEGVVQSASDLLRQRGLAQDGAGTTRSVPAPVSQDDSLVNNDKQRWGDEYRAVLPPPASPEAAGTPANLSTGTADPPDGDGSAAGTLTLDELREVQGVTVTQPFSELGLPDVSAETKDPEAPQDPDE